MAGELLISTWRHKQSSGLTKTDRYREPPRVSKRLSSVWRYRPELTRPATGRSKLKPIDAQLISKKLLDDLKARPFKTGSPLPFDPVSP